MDRRRGTAVALAVLVAAGLALLFLRPGGEPALVALVPAPVALSPGRPPAPAKAVPEPPTAPAAAAAAPVPETAPPPAPETDRVTGRVVDEGGRPVVRASVATLAERVVQRTREGPAEPESEVRETLTAPDGTFFLEGLRRDLPHSIRFRSVLHGKVILDFDPAPGVPGFVDLGDVVLPRSRSIAGRALDAAGEPIPGAAVLARGGNGDRGRLRPGQRAAVHRMSFLDEEARTDDRGRFSFEALSPGDYALVLRLEGAPSVEESVRLPPDRNLVDVVLRIWEGASIAFVLLDEAGDPVEGVAVGTRGPGAPRGDGIGATSDARGRVLLRGLPAREMRFGTQSWTAAGGMRFAPEEVGPVAPSGQEIQVVLHPPSAIRGSVVDDAGNPLRGIQVNVYEGDRWLNTNTSLTDAKGSFQVNIAAGRPVDLRIEGWGGTREQGTAGRHWRGRTGPVHAPADGLVLRCREVASDRTLDVVVLGLNGQAVSGAALHLSDGLGIRQGTTDSRGIARFRRVVADEVWLGWDARGSVELPAGAIPPASLKVVPAGQVVKMPCRPGTMLEGVVRDGDGNPLPGASVRFTADVSEMARTQVETDREGRFGVAAAPGLVIDDVRASWNAPEGGTLACHHGMFTVGKGPLDLVLRPAR